MPFVLAEGVAILTRTPAVLDRWLRGLPDAWLECDEGPGTWSPFFVLGHLIHGERTDWIPRGRMILERGESATFEPFDRAAMLESSRGRTLDSLLDEFAALRAANLATLAAWALTPERLQLRGRHPEFGLVTLEQLLATWTAHDLGHLAQIARTMTRRYRAEVGPWRTYLSLLR